MSVLNSLSKGIFVFKKGMNGKLGSNKKSSKLQIPQTPIDSGKKSRLWNDEFERTWNEIEKKVNAIQTLNNDGSLNDILDFVGSSYTNDGNVDVSGSIYMPVAALLTGINKPDYHQYFQTLSEKLRTQGNSISMILPARDCPNVKTAIENLVSCILSKGKKQNYHDEDYNSREVNSENEDEMENDGDDDNDEPPIKLRRNQYTLNVLQSWYSAKHFDESNVKAKICIVIPNFEEMKSAVLKDLILILSNHCSSLPFVLIFGVATTTASIFHSLSFAETTRIKLHAFSSQSPIDCLNRIIDDIILSPNMSFLLSGKIFNYLTNVFMSYDLTTKEFLRSLRFCMLEHFSRGNAYALCTSSAHRTEKIYEKLTHEDIETIRQLKSFRPYVESMTSPIDVLGILSNDEYFLNALKVLVRNIHLYFLEFHCFVRLLFTLVRELPQSLLGKHLRDIYPLCSKKTIVETDEFTKCFQYLELMSRQEMTNLLEKCCQSLNKFNMNLSKSNEDEMDLYAVKECKKQVKEVFEHLMEFKNELLLDPISKNLNNSQLNSSCASDLETITSRHELQQKLLEKAQQNRTENSRGLKKVLEYLRGVFGKFVRPFNKAPPLYELFVYSDFDDVQSHLKGAPRGAIHTALTNPQHYLQCDCCALEKPDELRPTMPDISVALKLLLECGQQVNIYDWMQAFRMIVDENTDDDDIPPLIQARFTRARAELQFLGFIKGSKRKTDHVVRTTW